MNTKANTFQGVIVPMVTPLTEEGKIDESSSVKLINFLQNSGAIPFILGTTGEAASMPAKERHKLIQILTGLKRNGTPAITGMIGLTVPDTVAEANKFIKKGIDAVVITLPYHYFLTDNQIYHFYKTLADRIEGNIILYNIPKTVNQSIPLHIIEKLSYEKNIIGIKDSELDKERLIQSLELWRNRKDFFHFTGVNALMPDGILSGSKGMVPATANFVPHIYVELYKACKAGEKNEIDKMFKETVFWSEIYQKGKTLGESLATLKYIMAELNLCPTHMMPPITAPENGERNRISRVLEKSRLKEKLESMDINL